MADSIFSFDFGKIKSQFDRIGKSFLSDELKPEMRRKMKTAVGMIYDTATTPRPMSRNLLRRHGPSVSSTAARYGVPVQTGNLRSSIKKEIIEGDSKMTGKIYPDMKQAPYARRVEYGFIGQDSMGRNYRQLPRPYMRPALTKNQKAINDLFRTK
jgi:hypothetical protein